MTHSVEENTMPVYDADARGSTPAAPEMTRRSMIKGSLAAAAIGLHRRGTAASNGAPRIESASISRPEAESSRSVDVMPTLAAYMRAAQTRELPQEAAEHAKRHTLDTLAAMVSGGDLAPGRAALAFARDYGGAPVATVVRSTMLIGPIEAALVNAMLAHADETDDSHAPSQSHPGCSVVPASLAAAERFAIDGNRFLRAVALGYDLAARINMTLGVTNFEVGRHQSSHAVAGVWGSTAAAGCAAGLSERQLRWSLAYAADQSSGTTVWQRDTDHIQKAFAFAGVGARNGVSAALMVHAGWTGVDDVFTGQYNFLDAYGTHTDPSHLIDQLGERYEVTRTNIKKWSVGSPIQAPLDAMQAIEAKHALAPDQVREITVRVATEEANLVDDREMPDISLQHMVAVMLVDKTVTFGSAHDKARMQDPRILRERMKVKLVRDQTLESLLPKRVAIVEVLLNDGTRLTERVDAVRGTAQNPMTREEVVAKARDLMTPALGASDTARLIESVLNLERLGDIRALRSLLQSAS
jgi:2-methylcitrate dehydratase PrpD